MIYVSEEDRKRTALAKEAARAFAGMVGLIPMPCISIMPSVLADFEYDDRANIVMAHWQKKLSLTALIKAVVEFRRDLLLVEPSLVTNPECGDEMRAFMVDRSGIRPLPTLPWSNAEAERLGFWTARRHWELTIGGHYA